MQLKGFEVGPFAVNTYLLWDEQTKKAAIVDPSFGSEGILDLVEREGLDLEYIINTHGHIDHVYGDSHFKSLEREPGHPDDEGPAAPKRPLLLIHEADVPLLNNAARQALAFGVRAVQTPEPDRLIGEGDTIELGGETLAVLHTPGHSPGGICLHWEGNVLVGDTLFAGSIGRTDLFGGSYEQLIESVRQKLFVLPDETLVHPGHGPATTIGAEKRHNPFFGGRSSSGLWLP